VLITNQAHVSSINHMTLLLSNKYRFISASVSVQGLSAAIALLLAAAVGSSFHMRRQQALRRRTETRRTARVEKIGRNTVREPGGEATQLPLPESADALLRVLEAGVEHDEDENIESEVEVDLSDEELASDEETNAAAAVAPARAATASEPAAAAEAPGAQPSFDALRKPAPVRTRARSDAGSAGASPGSGRASDELVQPCTPVQNSLQSQLDAVPSGNDHDPGSGALARPQPEPTAASLLPHGTAAPAADAATQAPHAGQQAADQALHVPEAAELQAPQHKDNSDGSMPRAERVEGLQHSMPAAPFIQAEDSTQGTAQRLPQAQAFPSTARSDQSDVHASRATEVAVTEPREVNVEDSDAHTRRAACAPSSKANVCGSPHSQASRVQLEASNGSVESDESYDSVSFTSYPSMCSDTNSARF
jgi:hypothetical protein